MTTIRVTGTVDEIESVLDLLEDHYVIRTVSQFSEIKSKFDGRTLGLPIGNVYVEVEL